MSTLASELRAADRLDRLARSIHGRQLLVRYSGGYFKVLERGPELTARVYTTPYWRACERWLLEQVRASIVSQ
jgi:hypothetical protein